MARIFDNGDTLRPSPSGVVAPDSDLSKYFVDRNSNGLKDGTCLITEDSDTHECFVDTWYNYSEGDEKGGYTYIGNANKALVKPLAKKAVTFGALYKFTDLTLTDEEAFLQQVDNSMAGQMRDCAECHVGGGAMEYVPVAQGTVLDSGVRVDLHDAQAGTIVDNASAGYNTFNYYIDQYDEDSDGVIGNVLKQNYADTGVLEMDCLMCHLDGYSWDERTHAIRKGNFDASRVAGAGLGTATNADGHLNDVGDTSDNVSGYGKLVEYDGAMIEADGLGHAIMTLLATDAIEASPPSANCSACHFDMHKVDWKKRGTSWDENMAHKTEVHGSLGCMTCHTRDDYMADGVTPFEMDPNNTGIVPNTIDSPLWTGNATNKTTGTGATTLGHDPSKGAAPFSSLWNNNDNNVRTCKGCHLVSENKSYVGTDGAVDPTDRHTELGFLKELTQIGGMGNMVGAADGTHLDIITCEGCHTKKLGHGPIDTHDPSHNLYEWGTGGALVDSTGSDTEGRLTDHENLYVERTMENNMTVAWEGGKIGPRNALLTMFWRDKDETFGVGNTGTHTDINADGQNGGMDPVNPSHLRNAMLAGIDGSGDNPLDVLTHNGSFDDDEISDQKSAIIANLPDYHINTDNAKLKLSFMGVFFKANHGTSPAADAWGAGGCSDCHGADKGFYNGSYDLKPRDLDASWDNVGGIDNSAVAGGKAGSKQVVPFTKVNMDNYSDRDDAVHICSTYYGPVPRPASPETPAEAILAGRPGIVGQSCEGGGDWTLYALGKIKADYQFSDFHPTIWAKGQKGRTVAIKAAYGGTNTIRAMDRSEGLWEANFVTGTYDGSITGVDITGTATQLYTTRTGWVDHLNNILGSNYRDAIHIQHVDMGHGCYVCHSDETGTETANDTYEVVSEATFPGLNSFVPSVSPTNGTVSCTTACHVASEVDLGKSMARISYQHSTPSVIGGVHDAGTNYTVHLDGTKSSCYGVNMTNGEVTYGTNTYQWSIEGDTSPQNTCGTGFGTIAECDVTWADPTGLNVTTVENVKLDVLCTATGLTYSSTVAVTGYDIGAGDNDDPVMVAPVVTGNSVFLQATSFDSEVADVQIDWRDNTAISTYTTEEVEAGITHVYNLPGTSTAVPTGTEYEIKVITTNDGDPNNNTYRYYYPIITL